MALYLGASNSGTFLSSDGYELQDSNGLSLSALPAKSKWKIILNGVTYHLNANLKTKESE
jgi:hypothetical protein